MKAFLSSQTAYPWSKKGSCSFRGYFIAGHQCYRGEAAAAYLCEQFAHKAAQDVFASLNGVFSIIWDRGAEVIFGVDRLRGLPLFYACENGEFLLSDSASSVANAMPAPAIHEAALHEYMSTALFVPGSKTLLEGLYQVQAGEYCVFEKQTACVTQHTYFQYAHGHLYTPEERGSMLSDFHAAYAATGRHLVQALQGRTAVIPLSGGADSRMVLSMLKKNHYEKVICFTYGKPGNEESEISRQVAAYYGYPWHFVPYSNQMWSSLRGASVTKAYYDYAFQYVSTPHIQDFPAVQALKEQGILPQDCVFVPGHSGDLIAGSHIASVFLQPQLSREAFLQTVFHKFFREHLRTVDFSRIAERFPPCGSHDVVAMDSQAEWFNIQERQAKFIVNSVRVYEFFGYEWLIPLWDNALFDFWERVPIAERYQRKLYFEAIGESQLPSTHDTTPLKEFAEFVRRIPGLRVIPRRIARLKRYFDSPLYVDRFVRPWPYFTACLGRLSPLFEVNDLICEELVQQLRESQRKGEPAL